MFKFFTTTTPILNDFINTYGKIDRNVIEKRASELNDELWQLVQTTRETKCIKKTYDTTIEKEAHDLITTMYAAEILQRNCDYDVFYRERSYSDSVSQIVDCKICYDYMEEKNFKF